MLLYRIIKTKLAIKCLLVGYIFMTLNIKLKQKGTGFPCLDFLCNSLSNVQKLCKSPFVIA